MITGILLGTWFPDYKKLAYCIALISFCFVLKNIVIYKPICIWPLILFTSIGYLAILLFVKTDLPDNHISYFIDKGKLKIYGIVDNYTIYKKNRTKLIIKTVYIEYKGIRKQTQGKIQTTVFGNSPKVSIGDTVLFVSKIKSIKNFNNPGAFDYKKYMMFKQIWGLAYVQGSKINIINKNQKNSIDTFKSFLDNIRLKFSDFIDKNSDKQEANQILHAIILGQKTFVSDKLRDHFNRLGIGHILAISGLHIGIVSYISFFIFKYILSYIKCFLWQAWVKKGSAILSILPILIYGLLSGMAESTQRAIIMVVLFLLSIVIEKEAESFNTLAIAAMIILVIFPYAFFSISFQLSFISVLAILYGLHVIKNIPCFNRGSLALNKFIIFMFVPLFAFIGTFSIIMYYFNTFSPVTPLANILIVPLIGFGVVPIGLFSLFIYPISNIAASWGISISSFIMDKVIWLIYYFSNFSFASFKTVTPSLIELFSFYLILLVLIELTKNFFSNSFCFSNYIKTNKKYILVLLLAITIFTLDACYWICQRFFNKNLKVTVIDVGQGNSALMELPGSFCMLIDGGGFSSNSFFDVGAKIVAPFLWAKKIKTIDIIVLSHPDSDHLNGLLYIADNFNVKEIWTNGQTVDIKPYNELLKICRKEQIYWPAFSKVCKKIKINNVLFHILYPPLNFSQQSKRQAWNNVNNNSIVMKVVYGSMSILFPGDIMQAAEKELVELSGDFIKSDILISPHHGSKSSSSNLFLDHVDPQIVIIPVGKDNRFSLPNSLILSKYSNRGYKVYRTDHNGAVTISTNGKSFNINSQIKKPILISIQGH